MCGRCAQRKSALIVRNIFTAGRMLLPAGKVCGGRFAQDTNIGLKNSGVVRELTPHPRGWGED